LLPETGAFHYFVEQVKHQCEYHSLSTSCSWRRLCPEDVDMARLQENMWVLALPKTMQPSNEVVWLCLHCLDLPSEEAWKVLDDVETHVKDQYVVVLDTYNGMPSHIVMQPSRCRSEGEPRLRQGLCCPRNLPHKDSVRDVYHPLGLKPRYPSQINMCRLILNDNISFSILRFINRSTPTRRFRMSGGNAQRILYCYCYVIVNCRQFHSL
jgi:hypothetical protein